MSNVVDKVNSLFKGNDKRALNPAKEISGNKLVSVKEFLGLFRLKRDELHIEIQRLNEALNH